MEKEIFKYKTLQAGQARPYQDSFYIYKIYTNLNKKDMLEKVKKEIKHFYKTEEMPHPFAPELIKVEKFATIDNITEWCVKIRALFTG